MRNLYEEVGHLGLDSLELRAHPVFPPSLFPLLSMKTSQIEISIFKELHVQSFSHSIRHAVFSILEHILTRNLIGVKDIGNDFTLGFVEAMDGEKDPRNLLIAFRIVLVIVDQLDFSDHAHVSETVKKWISSAPPFLFHLFK